MLQNADLCVRHIKGEENVAADILSRWGNEFHTSSETEKDIALIQVSVSDIVEDMFSKQEISFRNFWYDGEWTRINDKEIIGHQPKALADDTITTPVTRLGRTWISFSLLARLVVHNHISSTHPSFT